MSKNKDALFTDDQLIYAAGARCKCGAGLAYPKDPTIRQMRCWQKDSPFAYWSDWVCSDILTGRKQSEKDAGGVPVHEAYPFAFYEIKSENQPSANGRTTRPTAST